MKKKNWLITALALLLIVGASIGTALAFFTASTTTTGDINMQLAYQTTIEEPIPTDWTKHVVIRAKDDSDPVFVRVRAFAASDLTLTYPVTDGWTKEGDWWYYGEPLEKGGASQELQIHIGDIYEKPEDGDTIDVIVVHEYAPVRYNAAGVADRDASWAAAETEGGNLS